MTTFYQRLRHPFRRPTHYYTTTGHSQTSGQLEKQRERERQRALDEIENDLDDGRTRPRGSSSPDSLPVINDRGPYRGSFYPKDQLYFNSIMLATEVEPTSSRLPGGELRQETRRDLIWRPREGKDRSPSPRPVPSEWLTASQNAEVLKRWEQRHGINTMPARSWLPSSMQSSPRPLSPPGEPITPGTQEWDEFMGFPLDDSQHVHCGQSSKESAEATAVPKAPASPGPAAVAETKPALISRDVKALPQAQSESLPLPGQTNLEATLPGISPSDAEPTQALTWTSALRCILRNEIFDSVARATITERLQRSSSSLTLGHEETLPITLADVNLVPNFSCPIASSAFYDRADAALAPLTQSCQEKEHEKGQQHEELLSDFFCINHCSYASSNDTLYRDPTPPNWPLRKQDEDHTPPEDVTPLGYYLRSSSGESSDTSVDTHQRSPLTHSLIPEQVSKLLRSILTPSELALHSQIVDTAAVGTPPHPGHEAAYTASSSLLLDRRLIQKLDTALHVLQDRIAGLEDNLIPQLSRWLEQKNNMICEQDIEISHLVDEILELKHIADFGNRILSRCRERESELWLTLLDIQRKHREKHGRIGRVFSRARSSVRNTEGAGCSTLGDSVAPALALEGEDKGLLMRKELDALLFMAKQNVEILDEDMREMAERLQAYLARNHGTEGDERPVNGSWKDV